MQAMVNDPETEEGLKDFFSRYPHEMQLLAFFTRVSEATVRRWKSGENYPIGLSLLAVRNFLSLKGYKIPAHDRLDPEIRDFGGLIVHRIITIEDAITGLGYSNTKGIFRLVFGKHKPMEEYLRKLREYLATHRSTLIKKRLEAEVGIKVGRDQVTTTSDSLERQLPPLQPAPSHQTNSSQNEHALVVQGLAQLMRAVKPLATMVNSQAFTDKEREEFRRLVGGAKEMFDTANLLNWLCSDDARKRHFLSQK